MNSTPLHFHWHYTDVDRAFWVEHLEDWLPRRIIDATRTSLIRCCG